MLRHLPGVLLLAGTCLPAIVTAQGMEQNTDRPGQNYRAFDLGAPEPERCLAACQEDGKCRAWTYVKPGVQGAKARCWLKAGVPPAKPGGCCVSGVKSGGPVPGQKPVPMMQMPPPAVSPRPPVGMPSHPPADLMQRLQTSNQSRMAILRDPQRVNCWDAREQQCQQWHDAGSPPPMPPMDPACTQVLWFDPCQVDKMDCAKIPCPATFDSSVTCWICK